MSLVLKANGRRFVAAGLALGLAVALGACSSGIVLPVPYLSPVAPVVTAAPPAYLGGLDLDAYCAANFPNTSALFVDSRSSWTCGVMASDGSWAVTVQLSPADMTAACIQQYGGDGVDLNEVAMLTGSLEDGWGCYTT